jgi:competence protein ComEA
MKERRQRLVLWTGVLALTLLLFNPKGHETPPGGAPSVAFLHGKSGTALVRIAGDVPHPGIYRLDAPGTATELVRQVAPALEQILAGDRLLSIPLADGDVITVTRVQGQGATLAKSIMPARERMVLGIPLLPAQMTAADWEALPGIGPALTERIMTYGRQSGGIHTLDDLRRVDGIGDQTIEKLRPLFTCNNGTP